MQRDTRMTLGGWLWVVWAWVAWGGVGQGSAGAEPGQLHTSLVHMEDVFTFDQVVGDLLLHLPEHLPAATTYLESYKNVVMDQVRGLEVTGNPLHVYSVIKRLVLLWPHITPALHAYKQMANKECEDSHPNCRNWAMTNECLINRNYMVVYCPSACHVCPSPALVSEVTKVLSLAATTTLPTSEDLYGAALALARLQRIYQLPIGTFMAGRIADVSSAVRLTLDDCIRVANASHDQAEYSYALVWYRYCLLLADDHPDSQELLHGRISQAEMEHNTNWDPNGAFFYSRPLTPEHSNQVPRETAFGQVCRGEHKEIPDSWRLLCHINHRGSPFLLLQPIRYEQLHYDPEMYIFYDVISDAEINVIKNISRKRLYRSMVHSDIHPLVSPVRTSHTAWLSNSSHPVLPRLARRVAHSTGLHVFEGSPNNMAGEHLQVLNYGIGGHYDTHLDALFKHLTPDQLSHCLPEVREGCDEIKFLPGDRMATWIFYLSDVTAGGRTGFPYLGISVPAVRGAAVFWYNLKSNGELNLQSHHGGCPVLMGEKWVANKWIRENANFLRRPCTLEE